MSPEQEQLLMDQESRTRLPDPDEVLNFGYSIYVADDDSSTPQSRLVARHNVRRHRMTQPRNDVERAYLLSAHDIAVAFSRSLSRRKGLWLQEIRDAREEYDFERLRLAEARKEMAFFTISWGLVKMAAVALLGYVTAQVIGFFIPADIASETGSKIPGILGGLVFVCFFRWLVSTFNDQRRGEVDSRYRQRITEANDVYDEGKLSEFRLYQAKLCEAWLQYTAEEYVSKISYVDVMESDLRARRQIQRRLNNSRTLTVALRVFRLQKAILVQITRRRRAVA